MTSPKRSRYLPVSKESTSTTQAIQTAFDLTQGQPWLVNALAKEVVEEIVLDTTVEITPEHILTAKEVLIARQDTHLDSLAEKLREPRVQAIIEPILAGQTLGDTPSDDRQYLIDLARKAEGRRQKAEGIYPFPRMPEPSGRPERARGLSPPPKSLIWWLAISVGQKPTLYCILLPSALCLLPSSRLLRRDPEAGLTIANPIYREVIPRALVQGTQDSLPYISPSWLTSNGEKIGS